MDQQSRRLAFHKTLCDLVGPGVNVYYQPPSTIKIKYPCIVYKLSYIENLYADDIALRSIPRYDLTIIDRDPDSLLMDKISSLPYCSFDRSFTSDGLNHMVYRVYVSEAEELPETE